jgi:hypothetical protein
LFQINNFWSKRREQVREICAGHKITTTGAESPIDFEAFRGAESAALPRFCTSS